MVHMTIEPTDKFCTEQILASRNTAWDSEGDFTLVGNKTVNAPLSIACQTILINLNSMKHLEFNFSGPSVALRTLNHFKPVTFKSVALLTFALYVMSTQCILEEVRRYQQVGHDGSYRRHCQEAILA